MSIKQQLTHHLLNVPGWHTRRKILVIESDDWGSIRMPSKEVYDKLLSNGIRVDKCHYCANDSVASEQDLNRLFNVLLQHRDKNNNPCVITANAEVANPDFQKIKESEFQEYYHKPIDIGLKEIKGCENVLDLWREGMDNKCFMLQSHGREHLNVARWMHYLQGDYPETKMAFNLGVYGLSTSITNEKRKSFLPAFDFTTPEEERLANEIVVDGLREFERIFGFKSTSFIAPNYTWGKSLERTLFSNGVKYIQGAQVARYRNSGEEKNKKRLRYIGKETDAGLIELTRNAMFEPSENPNKDWVGSCLSDIAIAFRWRHPAIICSHRVNYISAINPENSERNLKLLNTLLYEIVKRWPDVEFVSSDMLGETIKNNCRL